MIGNISGMMMIVRKAGMGIVKRYPLGVLPLSEAGGVRNRWLIEKGELIGSFLPGYVYRGAGWVGFISVLLAFVVVALLLAVSLARTRCAETTNR